MIAEIKKGNLTLKKGIDRNFFNILFLLYKPFLTKSHLKDPIQYSIFLKNKLIGFVQIGKKPAIFVQIALIPQIRQKGIAEKVLKLASSSLNLDRFGWTADMSNYPSLKLLFNLGGGVFEGSLKNKKAEGVWKIKLANNKKLQKNLESILKQSKKDYLIWLKEYKKITKELKNLEKYLSS